MKEFKELILTLFKGSEERFKNPFFRAFLTSWVIFNWKPIAYFVFEKISVKEKITEITTNYSGVSNILLYPLISALFYYLAFPFITLFFDFLRKYPIKTKKENNKERQKDDLKNENEITLEKAKNEENERIFKERNEHNNLINELNQKIEKEQDEHRNTKEKYNQEIELLKNENKKLEEIRAANFTESIERKKALEAHIQQLNEAILNYEDTLQLKQTEYQNIEIEKKKLETEISTMKTNARLTDLLLDGKDEEFKQLEEKNRNLEYDLQEAIKANIDKSNRETNK